MKKSVAQFASEAEMCARFIAIATGRMSIYGRDLSGNPIPTGWVAYPETADWDILMVRKRDGFQIGIEAKLRLNDLVIRQALESGSSWSVCKPGPDCRAVLVPDGTGNDLHEAFCGRAGVSIIRIKAGNEPYRETWQISKPLPESDYETDQNWPQMLPTQRCELPEFVPDTVAGAPSPLKLTDWKIRAIKIACILERRGWLCRQDFKHIEIDHRRFLDSGWIAVVDGAWRRGPQWPDFRRQHPRNFDEIDALWDDWKPPELPAPQQATYGRLL